MNFNTRHFAATYYLPSWQGGDVLRAFCRTGIDGYFRHVVTKDRGAVDCPKCLSRLRRAA